jgi:hypothetical protein
MLMPSIPPFFDWHLMSFLKPKPNLPDGEKARVEFNLQQIAECLGGKRLKLPVQSMRVLLDQAEATIGGPNPQPEKFIAWLGKHLSHNVSGLQLAALPGQLNRSGGGG